MYKLTFFVFATLFTKILTANFNLIQDPTLIDQVGSCLVQIVRKEFKFGPSHFMVITKTYNLSELADNVQNNFMKRIFNSKRVSAMTIGDDKLDQMGKTMASIDHASEHAEIDDVGIDDEEDVFIQSHLMFIRPSNFYMVIVDGYKMFNAKIKQLVRVPSWNAHAPMVVYCSKILRSESQIKRYPKFILRNLWTYNVINAIILVHNPRDKSIVNIYSWKPYDPPERCGEKDQDLSNLTILMDRCIKGQLANNTPLFPKKVPKNLLGCPIKVLGILFHPFLNHNTTADRPGFDRQVLDIIAERVNFTIDLDTGIDNWGDRLPNGTWDGLMGAIKRGLGEIGIGAIYPDNDVHEDFDATMSYLQDSYAWMVPRAKEVPEWENLILVLAPTSWMATGATFWICTLAWHFFSLPKWETGIKIKTLMMSFLDSWCMYLSVSTVGRPNSNSMRLYYIVFCLYSMVWTVAYTAKLLSILTNPVYEAQIKSLQDLLDSGITFGGNEAFHFLFNNSIDETEQYMHEGYLKLDIHEVFDHVVKYRNLSILTSRLYVKYLSATTTDINDEHGEPLFYSLESNVFSFSVEMVASKGFPLLDRFNEYITLVKSNGLLHKFNKDFIDYSKLRAASLAIQKGVHEEEEMSLRVVHLQGAFMVLTLGNLLAFIAFIVEVTVFNIKNAKKKNDTIKLKRRERQMLNLRIKKSLWNAKNDFIDWSHRYDRTIKYFHKKY